MVDDHDVRRRLGGVEFEPYLFLDSGVERWWWVGVVSGGRHLGSHAPELGVVWRPVQGEVVSSCEFRLIDDRAVEDGFLHHGSKIAHSGAMHRQRPQAAQTKAWKAILIFALGELCPGFGDGERINR